MCYIDLQDSTEHPHVYVRFSLSTSKHIIHIATSIVSMLDALRFSIFQVQSIIGGEFKSIQSL